MKSAARAFARRTCRVICRINNRPPIPNRNRETKRKKNKYHLPDRRVTKALIMTSS